MARFQISVYIKNGTFKLVQNVAVLPLETSINDTLDDKSNNNLMIPFDVPNPNRLVADIRGA